MNAHRPRSPFGRQNAAPFTVFFFLLIVVAVSGLTAGVVQSSATAGGGSGQRPPFPSDEELKKDFDDDDLKVKDDKARGKWGSDLHMTWVSSTTLRCRWLLAAFNYCLGAGSMWG